MEHLALAALGWTEERERELAALREGGLVGGRVVLEHGRFYRVGTGNGELRAVSSGRLRHDAGSAAALPTVGDWVAVRLEAQGGERLAAIRHLLSRGSKISRRAAGRQGGEQVLAANVDTVLVVMALDGDFNLRRLERYLAMIAAGGAHPAVVLSKPDQCPSPDERLASVRERAPGLPVIAADLRDEAGWRAVGSMLAPGQTVALVGSSGVGKSTLLNGLAGTDLQRTGAVGAQGGRGRHTTSFARLFALPSGALVIDTPGLRELQLWEPESDLGAAFADVLALAAECRFGDCRHANEPGCAVRGALAEGRLAPDRHASFIKLSVELEASRAQPWARGRAARPRGR